MGAKLYAGHMTEILDRSRAITAACQSAVAQKGTYAGAFQAEFAFLQLRMICELVALSSLAAHFSLGLSSRLSKAWNAEQAFKLLQEVNPHCFPHPIRNIPDSLSIHNFHVIEGPSTFSRPDLSRVYAGCGEALHRGTIAAQMASQQKTYDLDRLNLWHRQIIELLDQHMILIRDPDRVLLVNMRGEGGKVAVYAAEAVEPEDLDPDVLAALDSE
jgi:hypothetical protein